MLKVPTSESQSAGTDLAPLLNATDVPRPLGAHNRLWPAARMRIRVTFAALGTENVRATGEDPDHHQFVFTTELARSAQTELIDALATTVSGDITTDTVVIPDKGGNGTGPKMTFRLQLGTQT